MNKPAIFNFICKAILTASTESNEAVANNLDMFIKYLIATNAIDKDTLDSLKKIQECLPELISLYKKLGVMNEDMLATFLNFEKPEEPVVKKAPVQKVIKQTPRQVVQNHYHYDAPVTSSSCGGGGGGSYRSC